MNSPESLSAKEDTLVPWYKHFWVWFIIALPATVVVAGVVTVFIAINNADSLVADNYYKNGLGINRKLAQDRVAEKFKLSASVSVDELVGEVRVAMVGELLQWPDIITMNWFHPTIMQRDFSIVLRKNAIGEYVGQLDNMLKGRWYVQLSGVEPEMWRLKTEADFRLGAKFNFMYSKSHQRNKQDGGTD